MNAIGLTFQQDRLLRFIKKRTEETGGVSPSFEEMAVAMDLHSKSGVHRLIVGLEERGVLRRLPHRARALQVVEPDPAERLRWNLCVALDGFEAGALLTVETVRALVLTTSTDAPRIQRNERRTDRAVA